MAPDISFADAFAGLDREKPFLLADDCKRRIDLDVAPRDGCLVLTDNRAVQARLIARAGRRFRVMTMLGFSNAIRNRGTAPPESTILSVGSPESIAAVLAKFSRDPERTVFCLSSRLPHARNLFKCARALRVDVFPEKPGYVQEFLMPDPGGQKRLVFNPEKADEAFRLFLARVDTRFVLEDSENPKPQNEIVPRLTDIARKEKT